METYGLFEMLGWSESALRQGFCFAKTLVRRRSGGSLALAKRPGIYSVGQPQTESLEIVLVSGLFLYFFLPLIFLPDIREEQQTVRSLLLL